MAGGAHGHEVAEGIFVGEHPGRSGALLEALQRWAGQGIRAVVSVVESPLDQELLDQAGLRGLHLFVRDFEAPTVAQLVEAVAFITAARTRGDGVLIHCFAGIGRSATVACAYLVSQGATVDQAIAQVRRRRSPFCVESAAQVEALEHFARSLPKR